MAKHRGGYPPCLTMQLYCQPRPLATIIGHLLRSTSCKRLLCGRRMGSPHLTYLAIIGASHLSNLCVNSSSYGLITKLTDRLVITFGLLLKLSYQLRLVFLFSSCTFLFGFYCIFFFLLFFSRHVGLCIIFKFSTYLFWRNYTVQIPYDRFQSSDLPTKTNRLNRG